MMKANIYIYMNNRSVEGCFENLIQSHVPDWMCGDRSRDQIGWLVIAAGCA
jgi:hypothetical protein